MLIKSKILVIIALLLLGLQSTELNSLAVINNNNSPINTIDGYSSTDIKSTTSPSLKYIIRNEDLEYETNCFIIKYKDKQDKEKFGKTFSKNGIKANLSRNNNLDFLSTKKQH